MMSKKRSAEKSVRDISRATRRHYSAEEKIRFELEGLRGEDSIAELCRRVNDTHDIIMAGLQPVSHQYAESHAIIFVIVINQVLAVTIVPLH